MTRVLHLLTVCGALRPWFLSSARGLLPFVSEAWSRRPSPRYDKWHDY